MTSTASFLGDMLASLLTPTGGLGTSKNRAPVPFSDDRVRGHGHAVHGHAHATAFPAPLEVRKNVPYNTRDQKVLCCYGGEPGTQPPEYGYNCAETCKNDPRFQSPDDLNRQNGADPSLSNLNDGSGADEEALAKSFPKEPPTDRSKMTYTDAFGRVKVPHFEYPPRPPINAQVRWVEDKPFDWHHPDNTDAPFITRVQDQYGDPWGKNWSL